MSNQHKESVTVSSAALSARLRELVAVVVKGEVNHREFSMRVPAEHDRDADLVMNEAANRLINQQTEIERLKAQSTAPIAEMSEALGDETLNSLSQVATGIRDLQAEIDAIKAQNAELLAALGWYGEHSRLARLITSEGDAGRNAIASDGGQKAREAIAKARGDL